VRLEQLVSLPQPLALAVPVPVEAVETLHRDVWERMRKNFAMQDIAGVLVERQQAYFVKRQDILKGIVQRSRRYLYHVVSELERRNMPAELALLPMVESGYNPQALSSAQAAGLWQFIPKTAKRYELAQTTAYDARRDVVASTRAALDYLQFLYGLLGDWHLALASYNWGEESVMAAVERNRVKGKAVGFEAITVPEETRMYVPKLQALKNIIANPELFGITLDPLPNEPYFVAVENTRNLDLRTAAKLAEMPLDEFLALNPAFNGATISAADTATILVPSDKVDIFRQNLDALRPAPQPKGRAMTPGVSSDLALAQPAQQN
jgi:membrane-bound lytic murein transglycosylase D